MKNINNMFSAVAVSVCLIGTPSQAEIEKSAQRKSIVDYWKNLYLRVDAAQRYGHKVYGFSKRSKTEGVIGGGLGYSFSEQSVRIEVAAQYANFGVTASPIQRFGSKTQIYTFNLYRDFSLPRSWGKDAPFTERIIPYLTAGVGSAKYSNIKGTAPDQRGYATDYRYDNKQRHAWNVGLGMKIGFDHVLGMDIGFKYFDFGSIPTGVSPSLTKAKIRGYQVSVSVLMNFW